MAEAYSVTSFAVSSMRPVTPASAFPGTSRSKSTAENGYHHHIRLLPLLEGNDFVRVLNEPAVIRTK